MKRLTSLVFIVFAFWHFNANANVYRLEMTGRIDGVNENVTSAFADVVGNSVQATLWIDSGPSNITTANYFQSPFPVIFNLYFNNAFGQIQSGVHTGYPASYATKGDQLPNFVPGTVISASSEGVGQQRQTIDVLSLFGAPSASTDILSLGLPNISTWQYDMSTSAFGPLTFLGTTTSYVLTDITTGAIVSAAPVPEPETFAMMLVGLGLLCVVAKFRIKPKSVCI